MKNFYLSQVKCNSKCCMNKQSTGHFVFASIVFCFLFCQLSSTAQNADIYKISSNKDGVIEALKDSVNINAKNISSLLFDLKPTVYLKNNKITTYNPQNYTIVKAVVQDINSLSLLTSTNDYINKINTLIFQIDNIADLKTSLDFSELEHLTMLRYIYVQCAFSCSDSDIKSFITANGIKIFYSDSSSN